MVQDDRTRYRDDPTPDGSFYDDDGDNKRGKRDDYGYDDGGRGQDSPTPMSDGLESASPSRLTRDEPSFSDGGFPERRTRRGRSRTPSPSRSASYEDTPPSVDYDDLNLEDDDDASMDRMEMGVKQSGEYQPLPQLPASSSEGKRPPALAKPSYSSRELAEVAEGATEGAFFFLSSGICITWAGVVLLLQLLSLALQVEAPYYDREKSPFVYTDTAHAQLSIVSIVVQATSIVCLLISMYFLRTGKPASSGPQRSGSRSPAALVFVANACLLYTAVVAMDAQLHQYNINDLIIATVAAKSAALFLLYTLLMLLLAGSQAPSLDRSAAVVPADARLARSMVTLSEQEKELELGSQIIDKLTLKVKE